MRGCWEGRVRVSCAQNGRSGHPEQDSIDSVQAWFSTIDADEDSGCVRGGFGHNACLRRPFQCQTTPRAALRFGSAGQKGRALDA